MTNFNTAVLETAKEKMAAVLKKRADELAKIKAELEKANAEIAQQTAAIEAATASMDVKAYSTAKSKKATAENAAEMYSSRYATIKAKEVIPEVDSDAFIDELVRYEAELSTQYEGEALKLLTELNDLTNAYKGIIKDVESVLSKWCRDVHANYRQNAGSPNAKKVRRDRPVAIHTIQYVGCHASNYIAQNIKSMIAAASE